MYFKTVGNKRTLSHVMLPILFVFILIGISYSQTTWEFSGTPYSYQKAHFDSATNVVKTKLGIQMHTFGAPYNQIDATLLQVMSEDTNYKVLLFGQLSPSPASGQINLTNRVYIESATGVPDYNYFLASWYSKKGTYTDYMVMQGHPYAWTTQAKLIEFQNIINFLISTDSVVFTTPYGYFKYLNDNSIPRTNKIQVILKLDDLRATTSYFYPCLPTYDFLVANKVKASIGVNKMEALTQSQIDTLYYYLSQTDAYGDTLFEIWNHGLDHSMTSATSGGNWSSPSTWPSGYVPTSADDVVIPAGVTITIDTTGAVCNNLTIDGVLVASNTKATELTVYGDVVINSGGNFTSPYLTGATANIIHFLNVYGDFTNSGGIFDFRTGSAGTTMRVINTTFLGSYNSIISVGTYSSSNNDFNGITVNKSNGAKVICASDVVVDPGASTCVSQLILTSGIIETGNNAIYVLSTTSANIVTPSATSYVNGALGRGMSNSAGKSCPFPVGDGGGYRPITVTSTTAGTATGHYVLVRCITTDANIGSTTYTNGIDTVSHVRYYQISYNKGIGSGALSMSFNLFSPSYGTDDGVRVGNTTLRVAYSTDERLTWNGMSQTTPHTTSLASPPTTITPTALTTAVTLNSGTGYIYTALAKTTGSTDNPLYPSPTSPVLVLPVNNAQKQPTALVLKWNTSNRAATYHVRIATDSLFGEIIYDDSTIVDTTCMLSSLTNNQKYYWHVNAKNLAGISEWSSVWNFTTIISAPSAPTSVSPMNNAMNQLTSLVLVWNKSIGAESYHGQVALDSLFTQITHEDTAIIDTGFALTGLNHSVTYYWRVSAKNSGGSSGWSDIRRFTTISDMINIDVTFSKGWNMVSIPSLVENYLKDSLFQTSITPAYSYSSVYIVEDLMDNKKGYWLKYESDQNVRFRGSAINSIIIPLVEGWNLIGSISSPVAVTSVTTDSPDLVLSDFFVFSTSYFIIDTIYPGDGCWVKASQDGNIILSASLSATSKNRVNIVSTSDFPPPPPSENEVIPVSFPREYALENAYPNPFNPTTMLRYSLSTESRVKLTIHDVLGQVVATISDRIESAGYRSTEWNANSVASGIYFYRLEATSTTDPSKNFMQVKKMLLLK
jgi:hypothetical protein